MDEALGPLAPGVYLVVMTSRWKSSTLTDKLLDPGHQQGVGKIPIPGFELRTSGSGPGNFSAFGIDLDEAGNLVPERLNHGGAIGFVLH